MNNTITSLIDLNTRILTPKLQEYWEQSKETTNYVGELPDCITLKTDAIILRSQNIGTMYDMLSPALLLTWLQGTGYVASWQDQYVLIRKDRTTEPLSEAQRNHQFRKLAAFWQQYAALKGCEFPQVTVIPDTEEGHIVLRGPAEALDIARRFLNGNLKSASRATYCQFLGLRNIPKSAILTESDDYTDRNSHMYYAPHETLITQLSQTRIMRDRQQCRVVVEHPADPMGNTGKTQSLAGSTFRACLEKDYQATVKDFGLYIKNASWSLIKGSSKRGELRLILPDLVLEKKQDSVILDDFEEA